MNFLQRLLRFAVYGLITLSFLSLLAQIVMPSFYDWFPIFNPDEQVRRKVQLLERDIADRDNTIATRDFQLKKAEERISSAESSNQTQRKTIEAQQRTIEHMEETSKIQKTSAGLRDSIIEKLEKRCR